MTRDEIYDHLAQVYLGKRKEADSKKKNHLNAWLIINIVITVVIFMSAFYGLTAFFTDHEAFRSNVIFSLHEGLVKVDYDFNQEFQPVKRFSLVIPAMDASKYRNVQFSIRSKDEGTPGVVKVILTNDKNETAAYYVQGVEYAWQKYSIPLEEFKQITDWSNLKTISFVLEAWNVEAKKGMILIDNICFSS